MRISSAVCRVALICSLAVALVGGAQGCTDARKARWKALGGQADVQCFSGGQEIYKGTSTGKVNSADNSDGYLFVDVKTQKLTEVSGACVITYKRY